MSDLRQRKFARTRLNLARVLADALGQQSFDEVSVKKLCRSAEVSEATFFNYFPRKQDLLSYLVHLWILELGWHVHKVSADVRGLAVVDALFSEVARTCESRPGVLAEMLAWIARGGSLNSQIQIGELEKQLAYPDLDGIASIPVKGIDTLLAPSLQVAINTGELPENTLIPMLLSCLLSVLFGVPLTLLASDPARIGTAYRQQLVVVLAGIRAAAGSR